MHVVTSRRLQQSKHDGTIGEMRNGYRILKNVNLENRARDGK
jgi:hypothetical protein